MNFQMKITVLFLHIDRNKYLTTGQKSSNIKCHCTVACKCANLTKLENIITYYMRFYQSNSMILLFYGFPEMGGISSMKVLVCRILGPRFESHELVIMSPFVKMYFSLFGSLNNKRDLCA